MVAIAPWPSMVPRRPSRRLNQATTISRVTWDNGISHFATDGVELVDTHTSGKKVAITTEIPNDYDAFRVKLVFRIYAT